jgi:hypothetical protein
MAKAAPLLENSIATISRSRTITMDIIPFFPLTARTRESAAYEHAIAFDATEYLSNTKWSGKTYCM